MNKHNAGLIVIGIIFLAIVTLLSIAKCAHENNKANVLWPEGRVVPR